MFTNLSSNLQETFKKLRGHGKISEKNIPDALREVRRALPEAEVEFSVAKDFIARVKEKALGETVLRSIQPGQQIVKIFNDEITELLGGNAAPLDLNPPARLLIVGLNGAGKTTTSAKLALHLRKEGRRPLLVACDLYRPAAIEQLVTLGKQIDIPVFRPEPGEKDVLKVAKAALKWAEDQNGTVIIFDTAGRQEVDNALVAELKGLHQFLQPKETLLVADSATGQQAVSVAKRFDDEIGLTGLILTKLDGDARGGAALSMRSVTGKPIKFVGVGEKLADLEAFVPDRMAGRILGMGDIVSFVEKAQEQFDEKEAKRIEKKIKKNTFDFNDFLGQMAQIKKMGDLKSLMSMIPGVGKAMKDIEIDDKAFVKIESIIQSMTPTERENPELLTMNRKTRIAKGCGRDIHEVNMFIKQFDQMRKMMHTLSKGDNMQRMMSQFKGR